MENKNYYDWLEISKKASPEVIEKAYKALVKKYHPDLQQENKGEAEEVIKKINEAYDVLSDEIKRANYDATLQDDKVSKEDYDKLKQELNNVIKNSRKNNHSYNYVENPKINYDNNSKPPLSQEEINYQKQLEFEQEQLESQRKAQIADLEYKKQIENARQKAYHDAYVQDLRNRGYKIRYKKTLKDYFRIVVTIIFILLFLIIIWHIPFVHNWRIKVI